MDVATLVGVGLLVIERTIYNFVSRVRNTNSKCSNCCETSTTFAEPSASVQPTPSAPPE
jgi:nitrate/TMAO reductase-like tetraheme cytochrome c subunit